jgi:hypothetical protein
MKKVNAFNIQKQINRLKVGKAPAYIIGQQNGLGLQNIYHPAFDRTVLVPKEIQISEFYLNMKENHNYMSEEYKHLLLNLKEIDHIYSNSNNLEKRIELSKDGIDHLKNFIEHTNENLPEEEYKVREGISIKLEEIWMRFKVIYTIYNNYINFRKEINRQFLQMKFYLSTMNLLNIMSSITLFIPKIYR